jgi:hypothetical protein
MISINHIHTDNRVGFLRAFHQRLSGLFSAPLRIEINVARALRLRSRGGIDKDNALRIHTLAARLRIVCCARKGHPWNEDLPEDKQNELFVRQCLEDVDEAVTRLFRRLPTVDEIDLTILTPDGGTKIITGMVRRDSLLSARQSSVRMRLMTMGLQYRLSDYRFDPMP